MKRADLPGAAAVSAASLAVAAGVAAIVGAWNPEETILHRYHEPLAAWLRGGAPPPLLTYPAWGYAILLSLLSEDALHAVQLVAASIGGGVAWLCVAPRVGARAIVAMLLVLGVPWHALAVPLWSPAPPAVLVLLALLVLGRGLERGRLLPCALGGLLLGLAANFRSEALALAIVLPLAAAFARWRGWIWGRPLHAALALGCALLALLPWTLHVRRATGHPALTSSNGGMVALISLGQLPGNPWGIEHHDAFASEWLARRGLPPDPLTPDGDRQLRRDFVAAIRAHPAAYARKLLRNLRNAALGGFYVGQIVVPPEQGASLDALREAWKRSAGLNPNPRERGTAAPRARLDGRAVLALAWQGAGVVLGAPFLWASFVGLMLARRRFARDAVLALFGVAIATQFCVMAALQYLPRHTTSLYPLLVPFAALTIERARASWRRHRAGSAPAPASHSVAGSSS